MNCAGHICRFTIVLAALSVVCLCADDKAQSQAAPSNQSVRVAMKNVLYHFNENVSVHIVQLQGRLIPAKPGAFVVFDDKNSFTIAMDYSEIGMACDSLAQVMNQNVFAARDAPIKKVAIFTKGNQLVIKGELHSKGDVPFETAGTLSATADGRIRFHAEHVKAAHLPVKGLLDLLGLDLAKL